jgi:membrane-bound lytic murein transglycosylase B
LSAAAIGATLSSSMSSAFAVTLSVLSSTFSSTVSTGWSHLAFEGDKPVGLFREIVQKLGEPTNDEGATVTRDEFRALLDDPRAREIYRPELVKYATPQSIKIQNAEHRSFLKLFMKKERLQKGAAFLTAHKEDLARGEKRFGVRPEDVTSILMWESGLGEATGKFLVVNTYIGQILFLDDVFREIEKKDGTMSPPDARDAHLKRLDRRKEAAAKFLVALLRSAKAKHVDPLEIRGSWAGAIGFPQFMPTSMRYAIDGDEDGKIDLYAFPDAIMSVASYLGSHGYKDDRSAAIYAYNADKEYVHGVMTYADAIAKQATAKQAKAKQK